MSIARRLLLVLPFATMIGCDLPASRIAGGADDHGNAVSARILVVDSLGKPMARTEVVIRPADWIPGESIDTLGPVPEGLRLQTDSTGRCAVPSLRAGEFLVRAGRGNLAGMTRVGIADSASVVIGVYATGGVKGRLVGAPTGTLVSIRGLDAQSVTDSVGDFVLPCVPTGAVQVVAGSGGVGVEMEQVPILDRKVSGVGDVAFGSGGAPKLRPVVRLVAEPLPPIFLQGQGQYTGSQKIEILAPILGDQLEVSIDGTRWFASSGVVRLGGSTCLLARSVQSGSTRSGSTEACYSIQTH